MQSLRPSRSGTFITYDQRDIAWISFDAVVAVYTDAHVLQLHLKLVSATLAAVLGDDYASYIKAF